ncbi:MAG: hypothetical protein RMJ43_08125 [Chloroherpetonaceae bacterium]|nr:hypothetical protein [Chthonomonadaceae bacterium]MDW8207789.1 hypothetical protein [Chloroherpetonaceae bacterium]
MSHNPSDPGTLPGSDHPDEAGTIAMRDGAPGGLDAEQVLQVLREEARNYRIQQSALRGVQLVFLTLIALLVVACVSIWLKKGRLAFDDFSYFFVFISLLGGMAAVTPRHKEAATRMAQLQDTRAVGLLTETLETSDRDLRHVVQQALPGLLRRLQASDAHLLDAHQRKILNRLLRRARQEKNTELALAVLKAYEQVGDASALPEVERLASVPDPKDARFRQVVEAARECLPYLKVRVEQERASQTLLRASNPAHTDRAASDALLRPAQEAGATLPEELLRATDAQVPHHAVPSSDTTTLIQRAGNNTP